MILFAAFSSRAEDPLPKESVRFDGRTLVLASQGDNPGEHVKEYIPADQKLDSWTQLASIRDYPKLDDPKTLASNLVRMLKAQNPQAPSRMIQNPTTGDVIVDFVTWNENGAFAEFNVFRYAKKPGGGLVAQQYAVRDYKDVRAFLKNLAPLRNRLVDLMAKDGLVPGK